MTLALCFFLHASCDVSSQGQLCSGAEGGDSPCQLLCALFTCCVDQSVLEVVLDRLQVSSSVSSSGVGVLMFLSRLSVCINVLFQVETVLCALK